MYWKAFDFTSMLMPVRKQRQTMSHNDQGEEKEGGNDRSRPLTFEDEKGGVWKVIEPVLPTPPCLPHTHTHTHTLLRMR